MELVVTKLDGIGVKHLLQHRVCGPKHSCVKLILAEKGLY